MQRKLNSTKRDTHKVKKYSYIKTEISENIGDAASS